MRSKYSWTHEYVDTGVLTMVPISSALLSIAWFHGPLMTRRFRSTDIHVMHVARYSSCHLIPNTHTQPHKNLNLSFFNQLEIIGYLNSLQQGRRRLQGCKKQGENKASFCTVFLHFFVFMFCFTFLNLFSLFSSLVGSSWLHKWTKSIESI